MKFEEILKSLKNIDFEEIKNKDIKEVLDSIEKKYFTEKLNDEDKKNLELIISCLQFLYARITEGYNVDDAANLFSGDYAFSPEICSKINLIVEKFKNRLENIPISKELRPPSQERVPTREIRFQPKPLPEGYTLCPHCYRLAPYREDRTRTKLIIQCPEHGRVVTDQSWKQQAWLINDIISKLRNVYEKAEKAKIEAEFGVSWDEIWETKTKEGRLRRLGQRIGRDFKYSWRSLKASFSKLSPEKYQQKLQSALEKTGVYKYEEEAKKKVGEETFKHIQKIAKRTVTVHLPERFERAGRIAVESLFLIILGIIVTSFIGSPWFLFAFLLWAASVVFPSEYPTRDLIEKIKSKREEFEKKIDKALEEGDYQKAQALAQEMKAEIEAEKMIGELEGKRERVKALYFWRGFKEILRAIGILFFAIGFIAVRIPFSAVIALGILFIGYFSVGGYRRETGREE